MGDSINTGSTEAPLLRWSAVCKECQRKGENGEFGYPDSWIRKTLGRGGTRSNRCPVCRSAHRQDAALMAVPYIDVDTIANVANPDEGEPTGPLGGLGYLPIQHKQQVGGARNLDQYEFGLNADHVRQLLIELETKKVAVVIAGTGSGKSTFLPFRLLYPPDDRGRHLADRGQIIVTQPRRCAATDIPAFVASLADPDVAELLVKKEGKERAEALAELSRKGYYGAGSEIGYRVSGEPAFDPNCRLVYVTDGSLLNWIRDGKLDQFGTIIIDEAHERSKNIDFLLALLRDALKRHQHLRVIIVSATIDPKFFVNYFGGEGAVAELEIKAEKKWGYGEPLWPSKNQESDEGIQELLSTDRASDWQKQGPNGENLIALTLRYATLRLPKEYWDKCGKETVDNKEGPKNWSNSVHVLVGEQVRRLVENTEDGDILVFLPTRPVIDKSKKEVDDRLEELASVSELQRDKVARTDVLILMASASRSEQEKARGEKLEPDRRRIVLSTNIAETSVTIEGMTFVVDTGLILQTDWDIEQATQTFPKVFHSRAGVRQRWGRVGRTAPGWVYPLYTEEMYNAFPAYTPPEAVRENAEHTVLSAIACGIDNPLKFMFPALCSPDNSKDGSLYEKWAESYKLELTRAYKVIKARGLIDDVGDLTPLGLEVQPHIGSVSEATALMLADQLSCAIEAATALKILQNGKGGKGGHNLVGNHTTNNLVVVSQKDSSAETRDRGRRYFAAMRAGCRDDLDLALKIYAAWERAGTDESLGKEKTDRQKAWAERQSLNHAFLKQVEKTRKEILKPLSHGKGLTGLRGVLPELAPRVRAVFSHALSDLAYKREDDTRWSPHGASEGQSPEPLGLDRRVLIPKDTSRILAFRRHHGGQKRALSNWVEYTDWASPENYPSRADDPWTGFVLRCAAELRNTNGETSGPTYDDHWRFWDDCEIGSYVRCQCRTEPSGIRMMQVLETLDGLPLDRPDAQLQTDDVSDVDDDEEAELASGCQGHLDMSQEEDLDPDSDAAVGDAEAMAKENAELDQPAQERGNPNWAGSDETSQVRPQSTRSGQGNPEPAWFPVKSASGRNLLSDGEGTVQIIGFESVGADRRVLVEPIDVPEQAREDLDAAVRGRKPVRVKVAEVITDWGEPYIVCRELNTGVRVVLGSKDLTLNKDATYAEVIPPGAEFEVTPIAFDLNNLVLRATRIPQVLRAWRPLAERAKYQQGLLPAHIRGTSIGNNPDLVSVVLDGGDPDTGLIFRFPRWRSLLEQHAFKSPDEIVEGAELRVEIRPETGEFRLSLPLDPDLSDTSPEVVKFIESIRSARASKDGKAVIASEPVQEADRNKLLERWPDANWREQVWEWWAKTHALKAGKVGRAKSQAEPKGHRSSTADTTDPLKQPKVGDIVEGTVNNIVTYGAFVILPGGDSALLHISQMSLECVENGEILLHIGQSVKAKITSIEVAQPRSKISLSQRALAPDLKVGDVREGIIKKLTDRRYGFIDVGSGQDLYFDGSDVEGCYDDLHEGQRVSFKVGKGPKGFRAEDVRPI